MQLGSLGGAQCRRAHWQAALRDRQTKSRPPPEWQSTQAGRHSPALQPVHKPEPGLGPEQRAPADQPARRPPAPEDTGPGTGLDAWPPAAPPPHHSYLVPSPHARPQGDQASRAGQMSGLSHRLCPSSPCHRSEMRGTHGLGPRSRLGCWPSNCSSLAAARSADQAGVRGETGCAGRATRC